MQHFGACYTHSATLVSRLRVSRDGTDSNVPVLSRNDFIPMWKVTANKLKEEAVVRLVECFYVGN